MNCHTYHYARYSVPHYLICRFVCKPAAKTGRNLNFCVKNGCFALNPINLFFDTERAIFGSIAPSPWLRYTSYNSDTSLDKKASAIDSPEAIGRLWVGSFYLRPSFAVPSLL